jgi:apolipoprotein N-acyltransferase
VIWTGVEFFRSELYPLKFSWLNIGYAFQPVPIFAHDQIPLTCINTAGMYGSGFLVVLAVSFIVVNKNYQLKYLFSFRLVLATLVVILFATFCLQFLAAAKFHGVKSKVCLLGIQLEFPSPGILPKVLSQAFAKHTNAQIFVLSEYTLDGPVPDTLKDWCRENHRYLVVGGKEPLGATNFYNTAFVIGTNGDVVFQQVKSVPIQFFQDGLPATNQAVWQSPWGKIGICICYDLSYTRVTDELVRQGAQLLIVPTMDLESWGRHQHDLNARVAPVRAAEYGIPIFRLASSGISQAFQGWVWPTATAPFPGNGEILEATLKLPSKGSLPLDRWLAPICTGATALITFCLLFLTWRQYRQKLPA